MSIEINVLHTIPLIGYVLEPVKAKTRSHLWKMFRAKTLKFIKCSNTGTVNELEVLFPEFHTPARFWRYFITPPCADRHRRVLGFVYQLYSPFVSHRSIVLLRPNLGTCPTPGNSCPRTPSGSRRTPCRRCPSPSGAENPWSSRKHCRRWPTRDRRSSWPWLRRARERSAKGRRARCRRAIGTVRDFGSGWSSDLTAVSKNRRTSRSVPVACDAARDRRQTELSTSTD